MFGIFRKYKHLLGHGAAEDFNSLAAYVSNFCSDESIKFHRPDTPSADNPPCIGVNTDFLSEYFEDHFVTLDTAQTITAQKTFKNVLTIAKAGNTSYAADIYVNNSGTLTIEQSTRLATKVPVLEMSSPTNAGRMTFDPRYGAVEIYTYEGRGGGGYIDFHTDGSSDDYNSRIIDLTNEFQFRAKDKPIRLYAEGTSKNIEFSATGSVLAKTSQIKLANEGNTASVSIFPEDGRIEILPLSGKTHGGYIDFHYGGSSDDYTARILDSTDSFNVTAKDKILYLYSFNGTVDYRSGIQLVSTSNNYQQLLISEPARLYSTGADNQIASRGYCRLNFAQTSHTHGNIANDGKITNAGSGTTADYYIAADSSGNLFRQNKSNLAPDLSNYVTTSALNSALSDYATASTVSDLADVVEDINDAYQDASDVSAAIDDALEDYVSSSSLETLLDDYAKTADLDDYVTAEDLEDYAKSVDGHNPNANGEISFGLTGGKFVKTDANGHLTTATEKVVAVGANDTPYSGTRTKVSGVSWNGSQIVVNRDQYTYVNGVVVTVTALTAQTIDTVAYQP